MSITQGLSSIKLMIESAIQQGGTSAKNNLIRSSQVINIIHEAVKVELVANGIRANQIRPKIGQTIGEVDVWGMLKKKAQDICVLPKITEVQPRREAVILNEIDPLGYNYTERILSINIRSQLSSAAKNFDTLYERTFAEALNFHGRCEKMVLGEVYMIAIREYDSKAADSRRVQFAPDSAKIASHVEKYIKYFQLINDRRKTDSDSHKYERIALLLVDFAQDPPKLYNTNQELIADGYLSETSRSSISDLTFSSLVPSLLDIYSERFGETP